MAGKRSELSLDMTEAEAQEALRGLLAPDDGRDVKRDAQGRFVAENGSQAPQMAGSGEQVDRPEADFDGGPRETVPEPSDPVAEHARFLAALMRPTTSNPGG